MKGDFSRNTFDPTRNYSRVLMQQGRVQLDSDFNEQAAIIIDSIRKLAVDINGKGWGPDGNCGFEVTTGTQNGNTIFKVSKGRYYVEGIACENKEPDFKVCELPDSKSQNCIIFLDVWERHITFIQDDFIREVALNGPDTCSRAEIVWKVRVDPDINIIDKLSFEEYISTLRRKKKPTLKIQLNEDYSGNGICSIPPESRYRGLENQLYRFEIHRVGGVAPATFKWSRDNGSVVFPIVNQQGAIVTLGNLGRDERTSLKAGDWVEITNDEMERGGDPGVMAQVEKIDKVKMMITLKQPPEVSNPWWPSFVAENHPLLRRWDHRAKTGVDMYEGAILIKKGEPIEIENGIEVIFEKNDNNRYQTGDYWETCARVSTGDIDWPKDNTLPPFGIRHYYAPLALITNGTLIDCRCINEPVYKQKET